MSGGCNGCIGVGVNGSSGGGGGAPAVPVVQSLEFDLRDQGDIALVNGPLVLTSTDGLAVTFRVVNAATATTFQIASGIGLLYLADLNATVYNSSVQTAPAIELDNSTIYGMSDLTGRGLDASANVLWQTYSPTIDRAATNQLNGGLILGVFGAAGLPSNSAARAVATVATREVNVDLIKGLGVGGVTRTSNYTTAPAGTANVFGCLNGYGNAQYLAALWGGSWASTIYTMEMGTLSATSNTNSSFRDSANWYAIAYASGGITGVFQVTTERLRFDWTRTR